MATSKKQAKEPDDTGTAAVDAALAEVDKSKTVTVTVAGHEYTFNPRAFRDADTRRLIGEGRDVEAVKWILGDDQYQAWLTRAREADEDGIAGAEAYAELANAMSAAVGVGNS